MPQEPYQMLQWKLSNFLKGQAMSLLDTKTCNKDDEKRQQEMKAIEDFTNYIRHYQENIKIINEYKEHQQKMIDDGR